MGVKTKVLLKAKLFGLTVSIKKGVGTLLSTSIHSCFSLIHPLLFAFPIFFGQHWFWWRNMPEPVHSITNAFIGTAFSDRPRMGTWVLRHRWFNDLHWRAFVVMFLYGGVFFSLILNQRGGIWVPVMKSQGPWSWWHQNLLHVDHLNW